MSFLVKLRTKNIEAAQQSAQGVFWKAIKKFEKAISQGIAHKEANNKEINDLQIQIETREDSNRIIDLRIESMRASVNKIRHIVGE